MKVITSYHGPDNLYTKVFVASEEGFNVTSTIICGKKECALIDTQWTKANALRVVAEILETGLDLKWIFATHAHPDHYWGMGEISRFFPNAKCYAPAPVVTLYGHQYQGKLDEWENVIGSTNLPRTQCECLEALPGSELELEGEKVEIIRCMGDLMWNTIAWIPSIKTVVGSDVIFNQAHPFTCEVTKNQRKLWMKDIEAIRALNADVIIPGHMREDMPLDDSSLEFMEQYLTATEEELERNSDAAGFFYAMFKRFPYATLLNYSNEMNAEVLLGGREWNWNEDPDPKWLEIPVAWPDDPGIYV